MCDIQGLAWHVMQSDGVATVRQACRLPLSPQSLTLDACKLPERDAPATDFGLYTNTSPGKAVRVREARVF